MVVEEFSYVAMDNSDPNAVGYEHRRRVQEAAKQANEGAAMHFNLEVTVGLNKALIESTFRTWIMDMYVRERQHLVLD